jgi:hypothetical protein
MLAKFGPYDIKPPSSANCRNGNLPVDVSEVLQSLKQFIPVALGRNTKDAQAIDLSALLRPRHHRPHRPALR